MTSRTRSARRIWGISRTVSREDGWLSLARRIQANGLCGGCRTRWGGGRWKSQNRKNVHLSPYVEEPLNSKVIKSFVSELRSRKYFSWFEIPIFYVYIYIWTLYVHFAYPYLAMVHLYISLQCNLKSGKQVIIQASFVKDDGTLFIIFN